MFSIDNQAEFSAGFEAWLVETEAAVVKGYKELLSGLYKYIIVTTPEYTGSTVASYKFGVNGIRDYDFIELPKAETPFSIVTPNFIAQFEALNAGASAVAEVTTLADSFYISNTKTFGRDDGSPGRMGPDGVSSEYVAAAIEDDSSASWLREVNRPGSHPVANAVSYMMTKPLLTSGLLV